MKVLLIHNKDITMEYMEDILEYKCIGAEVIAALPDAFTLEVMRSIHFDMVIGSIQSGSVGVIEDFLGKVRNLDRGEEIYTYMAVEKDTLCVLEQDLQNVVDDFVSLPLDREEFGYRLAKAAKRLMKHRAERSSAVMGHPGMTAQKVGNGAVPLHQEMVQDTMPEPVAMGAPGIMSADVQAHEGTGAEAEIEKVEREAEEVEVEADEVRTEIEEIETGMEEAETEDAEPGMVMEPSYDELLRARELRREKEKAEYERQERLKWERIEEAARKAALESVVPEEVVTAHREQAHADSTGGTAVSFESYPVTEDEPSYHDLAVRVATAGMPGQAGRDREDDREMFLKEAEMEEIPCEPSYEDLVRERELRLQREQEEARRQSMAKKFSGFNLGQETDEESEQPESASDSPVPLEEHRSISKADTIKEEIDLLKHLRKDYNVTASKVNTAKFKKVKKHNAEKRQKKEKGPSGFLAKVSKVFLLVLLVVVTTTAIFYFTGRFDDGFPVVLNMDSISNLWGFMR